MPRRHRLAAAPTVGVRAVALGPLALAAALASGCFDPVYDHPRCGPAGACPSGLTCVADRCEAVDASSVDASGCVQNEQCPNGHSCVGRMCVPPPDAAVDAPLCGPGGECPGGLICTGGVCQ